MVKSKSRSTHSKKAVKPLLVWLLIPITVILLLILLEATNTTHLLHKQKPPAVIPVTSSSTQKTSSSSAGQNQTPTGGSSPTTNDSKATNTGGTASSSSALIVPYGNFVSNHHPGTSGPSAQEVSVCNTTSGASCYIKFTNAADGSETKLPTQVTDSNGTTTWRWDINSAHLTNGSWHITAVASLNGDSKSTGDQLSLEVQ